MTSLVPSLLLLLGIWLRSAVASIYPVESSYWVPPFQRAEKLFATDQGPILARTGNSSVTVRIDRLPHSIKIQRHGITDNGDVFLCRWISAA